MPSRSPRTIHRLPASLILAALCLGGMGQSRADAPLCGTPSVAAERVTDAFGGIGPQIGRPSGFFRIAQLGSRKIFVTPEGRPFWMLGIFSVDVWTEAYRKRIITKYGGAFKADDELPLRAKLLWGEQATRRLKNWGFNTIAEYSTGYVLPTRAPANPSKMAFVWLIRPSWYGLTNKDHSKFSERPFKDLISTTDVSVYTYWRGATTPDVWDPQFEVYVDGWMKSQYRDMIGSPWLIGFATDDADNLFGFGPSPEIPAARLHPHLGWIALIASPVQAANPALGVTYTDRTVHSKYAIRDWLRQRYRTLDALNAAWGAAYTTWDSDGGWPHGRGLLDESGRHAWVGRDHAARSASPRVRDDLDEFLYLHAKRYFAVTAGKLRQYAPQHLVFGPASLNGWNGLTHRSILRAAGEHVDVLQASPGTSPQLELTVKYAGPVPIVDWMGLVANPDSEIASAPNPREATPAFATQQERGHGYATLIRRTFAAVTRSGIRPVVGAKLWAWADSPGEGRNWGLVTSRDNAYDGREAIVPPGTDAWGYATGGEERNYGDFLSAVRQANHDIAQRLCEEATGIQTRSRAE